MSLMTAFDACDACVLFSESFGFGTGICGNRKCLRGVKKASRSRVVNSAGQPRWPVAFKERLCLLVKGAVWSC